MATAGCPGHVARPAARNVPLRALARPPALRAAPGALVRPRPEHQDPGPPAPGRRGLRADRPLLPAVAALLGDLGGGPDRRPDPGGDRVRLAAGVLVDPARLHLRRRDARLRRTGRLGAPRRLLDRADPRPLPEPPQLPRLHDLHLAGAAAGDRRVHRHDRERVRDGARRRGAGPHRRDLRRQGRGRRRRRRREFDALPRTQRADGPGREVPAAAAVAGHGGVRAGGRPRDLARAVAADRPARGRRHARCAGRGRSSPTVRSRACCRCGCCCSRAATSAASSST